MSSSTVISIDDLMIARLSKLTTSLYILYVVLKSIESFLFGVSIHVFFSNDASICQSERVSSLKLI